MFRIYIYVLCLFSPIKFAASAPPTTCIRGSKSGPCGPGYEQCGPPRTGGPRFHLTDLSCKINDPNAPVYDAKHQLYHLFYQDHVAIERRVNGSRYLNGHVMGHAVSNDMVHWARLPVPLWNDKPYDQLAISSASATVVNESIYIVYPGLCIKGKPSSCTTGRTLGIAVPVNRSDPMLRRWRKPGFNPIISAGQRDPTTAWQESSGEWRFTNFDGNMFGTVNWKDFYLIGKQPGFVQAECPAFFPLPMPKESSTPLMRKKNLPTHVYKVSGRKFYGDSYQVGTYTSKVRNRLGTWERTPGYDFEWHKLDYGKVYASKDFYDPVNKRRVYWGWARVNGINGVLTLVRELTWHPDLDQLISFPIVEQKLLRQSELLSFENITVQYNKLWFLSRHWPHAAGAHCEVQVEFALPNHPVFFQLYVMSAENDPSAGTRFYVDYHPPSTINKGSFYEVEVGALRSKDPYNYHYKASLKLLKSERSVSILVFVDTMFSEAYFQNGRAVFTVESPGTSGTEVIITSNANTNVVKAQAWILDSMWVSEDSVLRDTSTFY